MKRCLLVLSFIYFLTSISIFAITGTGSFSDPYIITNENDLITVMTNNSYWGSGIFLELGADLDMNGYLTCSPIGSNSNNFLGNFNGNNHIIRNVTLGTPSSWYQGLFGIIGNSGNVSNINLEDLTLVAENYAGGICGRNYGIIQYCSTSGTLTVYHDHVGGVCGNNEGGSIYKCYSSCNITGRHQVGGFCGDNRDGSIKKCYSTGNISGGEYMLGGFCGINLDATIYNCYSTGNVTNAKYRVGGFCGQNYGGSILYCYSTGNVLNGEESVGGFLGVNYMADTRNSYSLGNANGIMNVGGFCGYNEDGIISNSYSRGNASGDSLIGGFCGSSYSNSEIGYCYSKGVPSGTLKIGGFIGENLNTSFTCDFWGFTGGSGFYDSGSEGDLSNVIRLEPDQIVLESSFYCFDFNGTWGMSTSGPYLTYVPTLTKITEIIFISLLCIIGGWFIMRRFV